MMYGDRDRIDLPLWAARLFCWAGSPVNLVEEAERRLDYHLGWMQREHDSTSTLNASLYGLLE